MRKIYFVLLAFAFLFLGTKIAQSAEIKIGYVELQKVFANYKKAQEEEATFKKEITKEQSKIGELQEEIKKLQEEFEAKKDLMKPEEKKKKEEEMNAKIQEFSTAWRLVNQNLDKKRMDLEKTVLEEITKTVKKYGEKHGYKLIIDSRVVLFGPEGIDLTEEITKTLNTKTK